MAELRKYESHKKYIRALGREIEKGVCGICKEKKAIQKFKHWKIVKNAFPYDRIAQTHHMLIPIRHVTEKNLTKAEQKELFSIKLKLERSDKYEYLLEAVDKVKSIPGHLHIHLLKLKKRIY